MGEFRHMSTRRLKKAYQKAFEDWEYCVKRYYHSIAPDHLKAMSKIAEELDARKERRGKFL